MVVLVEMVIFGFYGLDIGQVIILVLVSVIILCFEMGNVVVEILIKKIKKILIIE